MAVHSIGKAVKGYLDIIYFYCIPCLACEDIAVIPCIKGPSRVIGQVERYAWRCRKSVVYLKEVIRIVYCRVYSVIHLHFYLVLSRVIHGGGVPLPLPCKVALIVAYSAVVLSCEQIFVKVTVNVTEFRDAIIANIYVIIIIAYMRPDGRLG